MGLGELDSPADGGSGTFAELKEQLQHRRSLQNHAEVTITSTMPEVEAGDSTEDSTSPAKEQMRAAAARWREESRKLDTKSSPDLFEKAKQHIEAAKAKNKAEQQACAAALASQKAMCKVKLARLSQTIYHNCLLGFQHNRCGRCACCSNDCSGHGG